MSQDIFSLLNRELPDIVDFDFPTPYEALTQRNARGTEGLPASVASMVQDAEAPIKDDMEKARELASEPAKTLTPQLLEESRETTHEVTESGIAAGQKIQGTGQTVSVDRPAASAHSVSMEDVHRELDNISEVIRGILLDRPSPSVAEMNALLERLDAVITTLAEGEELLVEPAIADALTLQAYLNTAIASRTHCEERLGQLNEFLASDRSHGDKLDRMLSVYAQGVCSIGRMQTKALQDIVSGRAELQDQATALLRMGVGIVGTDLQAFELRLSQAMAAELKATLPDGHPASQNMLLALCRLALVSGADPRAMLTILEHAPAWTNQEHMTTLVEVMGHAYADAMTQSRESTPAQRSEILRFVDMLFQGAKFEASLDVLQMKKLLLPGHEAEAELQDACMLVSSHLLNHVLDRASGAAPHVDVKRTSAIRNAAEGVSAHSFLLTPQLVASLRNKVTLEEFNYHIAHVALLQKKAALAGLIPASDEQIEAMNDIARWCRTLGLSENVASYAGELDEAFAREGDDAKRLLLELQGASRQFVRGFAGKAERDAASAMISARSEMSNTSRHVKFESKMYQSSDDFIARSALDLHIANLSALEGEGRFAEGSHGLELNGEAVDRSIFINLQLAMTARLEDSTATDLLTAERQDIERLGTELERRAETQKEIAKKLAVFKACREGMESMEQASRLADMARTSGRAILAERKTQMDALDSIRSSWLHQHPERRRVCASVLRIAELNSELRQIEEALAGGQPQGEELAIMHQRSAELEHDLAALIESLKGVHPTRLVSSSKLEGQAPSLDVILGQMLPRARAMSYFHDKTAVDAKGRPITQAKADLLHAKEMRTMLKEQQKVIDKGLKVFIKVLGSPLADRIRAAVSAATLKVFCESQHTAQSFNIHEEGVRQQIDRQLAVWGLDTGKALIGLFVGQSLRGMTTLDGRLDMERLRIEVKKQDMSIAKEERKEQARIGGRGALRAWHRARKEVNAMLASEERTRWQGIHSLMQEASMPGGGFVYDVSRGLVVDTGSVFSPLSGDHALLTKINSTHPLSIRFQAMHDNSMTVMRGPNGTFSVLLKGGASASLGATIKLTSGPVMGTGNVSGGGSNIHGVALSFKDQADTEAFLREFMKPHSDLNLYGASRSWQTATQVRFIEGYSVSGSISGGFSVTTFAHALGNLQKDSGDSSSFSWATSLGLNITVSGSVNHTSTRNVHGETVTLTRGWKASASVNASNNIIQTNNDASGKLEKKTLTTVPKLNSSASGAVDFEDRWDLVIEENGISEKTKLETSCPANRVSSSFLRLLLLPKELRAALEGNPRFYDDFLALVRDLPPTARLVVERKLKESVLQEVRQLFVQARMAPDAEKQELLKQAHNLLASKKSYRSATLSIRNVAPQDISRNWSPGLGIFQYKRSSGFGVITRGDAVQIPLPPVADDGIED